MRQKIIMKVQMNCDKCRTKALKVAAVADGVVSMAIRGADKDELVVIGDGVDTAELVTSLRKKVGHTKLISVGKEAETQEDQEDGLSPMSVGWSSSYSYYVKGYPQPPQPYEIIYYEPLPSSGGCSIM